MHGALYIVVAAALWVAGAFVPIGPTPAVAPLVPPLAGLATTSDASYNWAGYVAEDGVYTAVVGTWIVPTSAPHPGAELSADAAWVGIGGAETRDLIQAGTQALIAEDGEVVYSAWYETLPEPSRPVPIAVGPGDKVTVSVTLVSDTGPDEVGLWHLGFVNESSGETYAMTVPYRSSLSSAEWVQEMPSLARAGQFIPLSLFDSISFLSGSTVKDGVATTIVDAGALPLRMTERSGDTLAAPTTLRNGGFAVVRTEELMTTPRQTPRPVFLQPNL